MKEGSPSPKPRLKVEGPFNLSACTKCAVKTECGAFALANTLREPFHKDAKALIIDARIIVNELTTLDDAGIDASETHADIFTNRYERFKERAETIKRLLTVVMTSAVKAQVMPNTEERLDDLRVAMETIVPEQDIRVARKIDVDALDRAGADIRYYAELGICGALGVQELHMRD